ncbi:GNAT family N-acetyltransferase [Pseudoduganella violacea]|uniref:RimJ/RimL family protein N-acetyltransferase n=1 Tax=Pseudoduganella violacea TaxID=1715466 RepID=A0A7W5BD40_9BURK|nr:GNAT family protein [Pseudoduganella violacea]MBB3120989.1 RimJ/RimL family protein N-acetyltransferase [Pseudoduganella violacea]
MTRPPTFPARLATARLVLRRYRQDDAAQLLQMVEEERRRLAEVLVDPVFKLQGVDNAAGLVAFLAKEWQGGRRFIISLWDRSGSLAGECYVGGVVDGEIEVGIFLRQRYERCGLAEEALNACIQAVHARWPHARLNYRCDTDNVRSCALALRCGFQRQSTTAGGRRRRDGSMADVVLYSLAPPAAE